jgi:hypothetical protein
MRDPQTELTLLLAQLEGEGVRVVVKAGWFWSTLHYLVLVVTFGGNREFLKRYYTTIGPVIGVPQGWETTSAIHRYAVLSHERVHVGQFRKGGLGNAWIGILPVGILYLLLPLPIGFAYFRWLFERTAYATGIRAELELLPRAARRQEMIEHAVEQLVGPQYGYTAKLWPGRKRVTAYFEKAIALVPSGSERVSDHR